MNSLYTKYLSRYLAINLGLTILIFGISAFLQFEIPSVINIIIAYVSGFYPGHLFAKDYDRLPEKPELRRFALAGLIILTAISALFMLLIFQSAFTPEEIEQLKSLSLAVWAGIIIFTGLIYYFIIGWGFKRGAKMYFQASKKASS